MDSHWLSALGSSQLQAILENLAMKNAETCPVNFQESNLFSKGQERKKSNDAWVEGKFKKTDGGREETYSQVLFFILELHS